MYCYPADSDGEWGCVLAQVVLSESWKENEGSRVDEVARMNGGGER